MQPKVHYFYQLRPSRSKLHERDPLLYLCAFFNKDGKQKVCSYSVEKDGKLSAAWRVHLWVKRNGLTPLPKHEILTEAGAKSVSKLNPST